MMGIQNHGAKKTQAGRGMQANALRHRARRRIKQSGALLVEASIAMSLLVFIALYLLKSSLNVLEAGNWTIMQNMTDAYLTYEKAYAEQVPYDDFLSNSSDWPLYPDSAETTVEVGKLPGGAVLNGTVVRTRIPDSNNLAEDGGTGTSVTNPAGVEVWRLKSVLTYTVGDDAYRKVRTVVRSR
ncbi:hypothetical protein [Sulfuriroseicoccus oceanibius]|uniref:Type II secretion system protein n=1 Tax=Sulfuriroseicoccus oceanibius TaxID=2707525 RepID=A0A6B3L6Q1_9BACT|nr:hypothetical protein [Sulfuriroseicoccus oceanibius]QQL43741.1 hypothetical protein G3M56_007455 [Sulfuriroseicoccus oceanibius]